MVLVNNLGFINAAMDCGDIVLREADNGLGKEKDIDHEAEDAVRGDEMGVMNADLVDKDYGETNEEA